MTDGEKRLHEMRQVLAAKAKSLANEVTILREAMVRSQPGVTLREIDLAAVAAWRLTDLRVLLEEVSDATEDVVPGDSGR